MLSAVLSLPFAAPSSAATFSGDFSSYGGAVYDGGSVADKVNAVVVDTFSVGGPFVYAIGEGAQTYSDWVIIKYDGTGVKVASATLAGPAGNHDYPFAGVLDGSGNLYVAGCIVNSGMYCDATLRKYGPSLVESASATYDGAGYADVFRALAWDSNGRLLAAGYSDSPSSSGTSSTVIFRYDDGLVLLASAAFTVNGQFSRGAMSVAVSPAGDIFLGGERSVPEYDFLTLKYDSNLVFKASATFNGSSNMSDRGTGIALDPSGNVYVTGLTYTPSGGADIDMLTLKYSPSLVRLASATYGGAGYQWGNAALWEGNDLIVAGMTTNATPDWVVLRYSTGLALRGSVTYDGGGSDNAFAVARGTGDLVYVAGESVGAANLDFRTRGISITALGMTPPPSIGAAGFTGEGSSSLTAVWTSAYPNGTLFYTRLSSGPFPNSYAGNASSDTYNLSAGFTGLNPNISYYVQAGTAAAGPFVSLGSTSTLAAVPTGISFSGVSPYAIPLAWSSGGSGPGVTYGVLYSTAANPSSPAGAAVFGSTAQASASYTATGLSSATAYYFQVRAFNNNGVPSSYSAPVSTVTTSSGTIAASGFSSVGSSSLTVVWTTNWPAGTVYYARLSTGSFPNSFGGNASSDTVSPSAGFSGLNPNLAYYLQVGTTPAGPFTQLGSTLTHAAVPSGLSFGAPGIQTIPLSWSSAGNGAGVTYTVLYSTASDPSAPAGAAVWGSTPLAGTSMTASNLAAATTYFFQVRAVDNNGVPSSYAAPVSTVTLPNGSFAPLGFSGIGTASMTVTWSSDWPGGTACYARISTGAFPNSYVGNGSSDTYNSTASFGSLSPNVTYYVAVGTGPAGPFTALGSTSTLAAAPSAVSFAAPGVSTITLTWSSAGNGTGASYVVIYTTAASPSAPAGAVVSSGATAGTSFTAAGLGLTTLYSFQVKAVNNNGVSSPYSSVASTPTVATGAIAPAGFSGLGTSGLSAAWTSSWPPGFVYYSRISSGPFPNSFSGNASSDTANLGASYTGLSPNVTYYVQVGTSALGPFVQAGSTSTLAAVPSGLALSPPGVSTVTLSWSSAGNGAGVTYRILYSTAANPSAPAGAVVVSSDSAATSLSATGLNPASTFFFQVCAVNNNGVPSAYASPVSTATWPDGFLTPTGFSGIGTSSLTAAWGSSFWPGTQYYARVSSGPFPNSFSGNSSSDTYNLNAWFTGLSPNVTYYVQVATSAGGPFTQLGSTSSLAAVPSGLGFGPVSSFSVPVTWSAGGNGPGVTYGVLYSTAADPSAPAGASVVTAGTGTASFNATGLSSATAYYFQVRAFNNNGVPSAYSAPVSTVTVASGTIAGAGFSGVGTSSLTVSWMSNWPAGTVYYSRLSSGPFPNGFSGNSSSNTLNLGAWFTGLGTNVLYYAQVGTTPAGPFTPLGSTATLAAAPAGTGLVSSTYTLVNLNWNANGNPAGTNYELWRDVTSGFPSPVVVAVATEAAASSGLSPDTVYHWKVRALSQSGAATSFDAVFSTRTPAAPAAPEAPGAPTPDALWSTAISWTWTSAARADSYRLYAATSPTAVMAVPAAPPFVQTGLSPNASYGVLAAGANASGIGPKTASVQVVTLANQPAGTSAFQSGSSSGTVTWTLNGNPGGTTAEVQRSTNGVLFSGVFTAPATTYIDGGLIGCTSYFYKVRYKNSAGAFSPFDTLVWFHTRATTAAPPGNFTAESLPGNKIGLWWTPSPTEGIVAYRLYGDGGTGTVDLNNPLAVLGPTDTSYTTGVLLSSASYTFVLRSSHRCGVESPLGVYASAGSVGALADVRAGIKTPGAGHHINGDRVTVNAELLSGTPEQVQQIALQYRASGAASWTNITATQPSHPNPATEFPFLTHWNVTGLASGSYDLRAVAYNVAGTSDPAPASITVVVDPVHPDIAETLDAVIGKIVKTQTVNSAVATSITSSGLRAEDPVAKIVMPAGIIADSSATIRTVCNPDIPAAIPAGMAAVGSAVKIDLTSGQSLLSGTAEVTLSYPDTVADPSKLKIISLNEATGVWDTGLVSTVNTDSHTITGMTSHFSIFAVITGGGQLMANLDSVRVYPVPWKPNGGNADEGKPFAVGDPTSGIVFDRLPVAVSIKIYTLRGRLVTMFETQAGTGSVRWDGTNLDGREAASGGYFAVISAPGLKSVVKKIVVIR